MIERAKAMRRGRGGGALVLPACLPACLLAGLLALQQSQICTTHTRARSGG